MRHRATAGPGAGAVFGQSKTKRMRKISIIASRLSGGHPPRLTARLVVLLVWLWLLPSGAMAQTQRPRKTLREMLQTVDSLRLQLRQSADSGRMLQWADSLLVDRLSQSTLSEKRKARLMKRFARWQSRLSRYDRKLHWGDSLLAARYGKVTYDTAYIARPQARWTIKMRGNVSGATINTSAKDAGQLQHNTRLRSDMRATLSVAVAYRGLAAGVAVNPAKWAGKSKDFEFNLNSYSNRYGFDVVYLSSNTFRGSDDVAGVRQDIGKGQVSQDALNLNFYYAFNHRRFSFPAAFSQSYIQRRSAGSWMLGASFDGSKTRVEADDAHPAVRPMTIRLNEVAVGGGYAYNLVTGRHWLFHLSALPTLTVYSHDYTKQTEERDGSTVTTRTNMHYHFPSVIVTGRGAALYSWRNKFAGATVVVNSSVAGDRDHLQLRRSKWRARMFFGFRF